MQNYLIPESGDLDRSEYRLVVENVTFKFPQFALGSLSWALSQRTAGLIGPNGSGKTTLMRVVSGLLEQQTGRILIDGIPHDALARRQLVALGGSGSRWYNDLSFAEHFRFLRPFYTEWSVQRVAAFADRFELPLRKKVGSASSGMLVKFSLIVALARNARVILLDEPWNALDPTGREELTSILQAIREETSAAVLISSHELSQLSEVASDCIFLSDGQIIANGSIANLMESYSLNSSDGLARLYSAIFSK